MFKSKDGKSFGSAYVAKKRDSMHAGAGDKSMPMGESKAAPRTNPQGEALMSAANANAPDNDVKANPEGVDAASVVAQHGPAVSTTVHHDHKGGNHVVVSRHANGHVHTSKHSSAKDAHDEAAQLAGADQPAAGAPAAPEAPESDGFSLPKLA